MNSVKLTYNVQDKPPVGQTIMFALQQLLAIIAATIAVPASVNADIFKLFGGDVMMSQTAALFGAGVGTLVYLCFTKFRSPVFLGSSFAFIPSMCAAVAGALSVYAGFAGFIIGALIAGLVYVILAIVVKAAGTGWIDKLMPASVIGPTVAIIGLALSGSAVGQVMNGGMEGSSTYVSLICGLVTLAVTMLASVYGKKTIRMIPFVIGILAGYCVATIFTLIGSATGNAALMMVNFSIFKSISWIPEFTFIEAAKGFGDITGGYLVTLFVAYAPVAFVVFAEHLADHKNLSTVIGRDLTKDPGLHRTLMGDGIGSFAGAFFGGCANTTYGESIACTAISGNASVITIVYAAIMAIVISFFGPFATFLASIPSCVMGGVCFSLYGFIAVSGLKMIQKVDFSENKNLFVVSVILVAGVGGMSVSFGAVRLTNVACALILGILTNVVMSKKKD